MSDTAVVRRQRKAEARVRPQHRAAPFALLPFAASGPSLLLLQVPNALWTAVLVSLPMVLVQREIPGGAGTAAALFSATFPVAQLLAGALTGLVAARTGYSGTFWCGAALCALACVLLRARGRAGRNLPG